MRSCPKCQHAFPVVEGVDTQECPHCGHEMPTRPERAPRGPVSGADPAGAAAHAFRFTGARYGALLLLWVPAALADLLGSLALTGYQQAAAIPEDLATMSLGAQMRFLGVALPILLTVYGAKFGAWVAVAAFVGDAVDPQGGRLQALRGRGLQVMAAGLVLALIYLAGLVLLVVPFVIFFHWFLFAPAALAQPGTRIGAALEASRRFAKERRTFGFTALVLLVLAAIVVTYAVLASIVLAALEASGVSSPYVGVVVQVAAAWLVAPLVSVLPASYYHLAKQAPQEAPVDPAAPPAERFRTTKCPGCGTLVPYTATGQSVDVTCPVCGRAGKVL